MSLQPKTSLTPEEYLAIERQAEYKSEDFNGEMFAMSGASPRQVLIVTDVIAELRSQLKQRPCTVYRWLLSETNCLEDSIYLPSLAYTLALTEIYDTVEMGNPA